MRTHSAIRSVTRGFTLVEMLIALTILAIALGIITQGLEPDDHSRLASAAEMVVADLEYTQSLSIATPGDLALVMFDPAASAGPTWWVAHESAPTTPITKPYTSTPYQVTLGQGVAVEITGVSLSLVGVTDTIVFDAFGRTTASGEVRVRMTNPAGSMDVVISSATGFITIENVP